MALPRSRNHDYQPKTVNYAGSQVRSYDLNDLQDQIVELWKVGAFRLTFLPYRITDGVYSGGHTRVVESVIVTGLAWSFDGERLFVVYGSSSVRQFNAARPWSRQGLVDSGLTLDITEQVSGSAGPRGLFVSADGTKLYVGIDHTSESRIAQYTLTTANSLTGATHANTTNLTQDTAIADFVWSPDGTKLWMLGDANNTVYQYTASTPWSASTLSYASLSLSVAAQTTSPRGLDISNDGKSLFVGNTDVLYRYSLPTAYSLASAAYASESYTKPLFLPIEHGYGLRFSADGCRFIVPAEDPTDSNYTSVTEYYCTRTVIG